MTNSKFANPPGVLDKTYTLGRKTKRACRYRLKRRTYEVIKAIKKHHSSRINAILDIGAAEGLMLGEIKREFLNTKCLGLEYSQELIDACEDKSIEIIQGNAQNLPFQDNSFDVAVATAIIEHLSQPLKMLTEAHRVLKKDGILITTTPDPFFEKIATIIGHLDKESHLETFTLKKLGEYFRNTGFQVLQSKKFMLSPIGCLFELKIERLLKFLKLDFILLNQIIVGKK